MAVSEEYELQQTTEDERRLIRNTYGNSEHIRQGVMRRAVRCMEAQETDYTFKRSCYTISNL
jgi:hypothetical protein